MAEQCLVRLRQMTVEDTEKIVAWRNKEFVRRNFIYQELFTKEGHLTWIREQVETGHVVQFVICLSDGRQIGSVYLRDIDREAGTAEYGIFIGEEDALGRGYGTEAARQALLYGFTELKLRKIFLRFLADNIGAEKSYEHAGFRLTDRRERVMTQQGEREVCFMEIDRDTWEGRGKKRMSKRVSFVIPCYRSAETIGKVVAEIDETMGKMPDHTYEIVLVNDSSPDNTFEVIRSLCAGRPDICGVNLARNFGQHAALMAGFRYTHGDVVVCLDDDGQTPAEEAGKLLDKIEAGYDVVYAKYTHKQHSGFRNFGSKINELMTRVMLGKPKELYLSSYFAARRFVIEEILRYTNPYPYVIGLVLRTTKRIANVEVSHREREVGVSGYTLGKLFGLWFNGFTAFSIKPLRIATAMGCVTALGGFSYGIYTVIKKFINPAVPVGFSAMMAATVFLGGMIMLMLGLIGEYLGRIYISLNNSPQYVIRECINAADEKPLA